MTAFLFIGQGSALPWLAPDALGSREVQDLLAVGSEASGADLAHLLSRGGRDLARTELEQPAMVAVCLGMHRHLERAGVEPRIVIGHSLGELTAWAAGGAIDHEAAVRIAATRGRLMAREAARAPGGLVRLIGDRAACEAAMTRGLSLSAHNGADEWVLGGDERALARAIAECGASRLPIAGPWHTAAIEGAVDEFRALLDATPKRPLRAQFISNRTGTVAADADIPRLLAEQLTHPVQWVAMMETTRALEPTRYLAVGPGKNLRALVQRNLGAKQLVEIVDSLRRVEEVARA